MERPVRPDGLEPGLAEGGLLLPLLPVAEERVEVGGEIRPGRAGRLEELGGGRVELQPQLPESPEDLFRGIGVEGFGGLGLLGARIRFPPGPKALVEEAGQPHGNASVLPGRAGVGELLRLLPLPDGPETGRFLLLRLLPGPEARQRCFIAPELFSHGQGAELLGQEAGEGPRLFPETGEEGEEPLPVEGDPVPCHAAEDGEGEAFQFPDLPEPLFPEEGLLPLQDGEEDQGVFGGISPLSFRDRLPGSERGLEGLVERLPEIPPGEVTEPQPRF